MKKFTYLAIACILGLSACTVPFKKAKDGTQYKIVANSSGKKLMKGNFFEMNVLVKYEDSVLVSSIENGMPQFAPYDTAQFPPLYKEIFKSVNVGDSIIIKLPTDSIIAKGQSEPYMKKGKFVYQIYKITKVYNSKEEADAAQKMYIPAAKEKAAKKQEAAIAKEIAKNKTQIDADSKLIEDYLTKNNIKATKTPWGVYIAVQTEGTGNALTKEDVATVNYTGKSLGSDTAFDSNVDPKFKHVQPFQVALGQVGSVILGWTDALLQLKKGSKATVFIPSSLAYGAQGKPPVIKENDNLVFDIEVKDVTTEAAEMAKQEAAQKQMMEAQQKMKDSTQHSGAGK
jgi:FKBP-type peptidyl-prolyl cis-trans isomerase FkpA